MKKCARCEKCGAILRLEENCLCVDCRHAVVVEAESSWVPVTLPAACTSFAPAEDPGPALGPQLALQPIPAFNADGPTMRFDFTVDAPRTETVEEARQHPEWDWNSHEKRLEHIPHDKEK